MSKHISSGRRIAPGRRIAVQSGSGRLPGKRGGDGEAALELFDGKKPDFDVIVLDVMLPGKDGFTVISELRQAGQFVPTLMLTARGHPEDVLKGFSAGADDYLAKPFDLSILIARIRGLLRRRDWLVGGSGRCSGGE